MKIFLKKNFKSRSKKKNVVKQDKKQSSVGHKKTTIKTNNFFLT
jgi:hypothetical protein